MLSVLAFKRSLSAGILDGGQSEISLGGSRLSRFMKEVENVTGRMGDGEAMAPAEEAASVASTPAETSIEAVAAPVPEADMPALQEATIDPWTMLLQAGAQLASALSHPWLERDAATGVRSLRLPVPPPETAQRLADALSAIADALRGSRPGNDGFAVRR
jgi:hypothetical protein